jgi:hypothetical protein
MAESAHSAQAIGLEGMTSPKLVAAIPVDEEQVRDFDAKYQLWYLCKPVIGAIFGWFVYLVYYVGLVSVQGVSVDVKTPAVPYAIAFLAGFSERFTVQIIDKLMEVLATSKESSSTGPRTY